MRTSVCVSHQHLRQGLLGGERELPQARVNGRRRFDHFPEGQTPLRIDFVHLRRNPKGMSANRRDDSLAWWPLPYIKQQLDLDFLAALEDEVLLVGKIVES